MDLLKNGIKIEGARDDTELLSNKGVWEALKFAWGNKDFPVDRGSKAFAEFARAYWHMAARFAPDDFWKNPQLKRNDDGTYSNII